MELTAGNDNWDGKMILYTNITDAQTALLVALVEEGPIEDSKVDTAAKFQLVKSGLAVIVCCKGARDFTAATNLGANLYCRIFNSMSLKEALQNRKMVEA